MEDRTDGSLNDFCVFLVLSTFCNLPHLILKESYKITFILQEGNYI